MPTDSYLLLTYFLLLPGRPTPPPAPSAADRDWSRVEPGTPHPYEYLAAEVTRPLLRRLRRAGRRGCAEAGAFSAAAGAAYADARGGGKGGGAAVDGALFARGAAAAAACAALRAAPPPPPLLGARCPLLARKFLNATASAALAALLPCRRGLGVLNAGAQCARGLGAEHEAMLRALGLEGLEAAAGRARAWAAARRGAAAIAAAACGLAAAAALARAVAWRLRKRRRAQIPHNASFHTALREFGLLD